MSSFASVTFSLIYLLIFSISVGDLFLFGGEAVGMFLTFAALTGLFSFNWSLPVTAKRKVYDRKNPPSYKSLTSSSLLTLGGSSSNFFYRKSSSLLLASSRYSIPGFMYSTSASSVTSSSWNGWTKRETLTFVDYYCKFCQSLHEVHDCFLKHIGFHLWID